MYLFVNIRFTLLFQSSDIIKTSVSSLSQLSISCDISEVPSVHCKLIISKKNQDIGAIGTIKFEKSRPIASASFKFVGSMLRRIKGFAIFQSS